MSDFAYLMNLKGKELRFNKGGPNSIWGKLLEVSPEYVVVQTKDQVVYLMNHHIKSIGESIEPQKNNNAYSNTPEFLVTSGVRELVEQLKLQSVQLNLGGPEKVTGVVGDYNEDYMVLVHKEELLRIPTFHITAISILSQNQSEEQSEQSESSEEKKSSKSKNQKDKSKKK